MERSSKTPKQLFEQTAPREYLEECTEKIAKTELPEDVEQPYSFLVYRIGKEWFAIETYFVKEVLIKKTVHRIPHRSDGAVLGLVNLSGKLEVCLSLHYATGGEIVPELSSDKSNRYQDLMIAVVKGEETWVFPVDDVMGIFYWKISEMENIPINLAKSSFRLSKGIFKMGKATVCVVDEDLLFTCLRRFQG